MGKITTSRSGLASALELAALLLFQGCYPDTFERGCVVKIEHGERSFPPDYNILFQNPDDSSATFTRHAGASSYLEVGKCYEWKLGLRDPSVEGISKEGLKAASQEIASDTVHVIDR